MSTEIRKSAEYQRILRETELGSKKRQTRMAYLIDTTCRMMKLRWLDKRVKVTSPVREGVVIEVKVVPHKGLTTMLKVRLDGGGYRLCAVRYADLL